MAQAPIQGPRTRPVKARAAWRALLLAAFLGAVPAGAHADWTASGTFQYTDRAWDRNGFTGATPHLPIRYARVEIRDARNDSSLAAGGTDGRGYFSIHVPDTLVRDVYARVFTVSSDTVRYHVAVRDALFANHNLFSYASPTFYSHTPALDLPDPEPIVAPLDHAAPAFNILDCLENGIDYITAANDGRRPADLVTALWVRDPAGRFEFYGEYYEGLSFGLKGDDAFSDMFVNAQQGMAMQDAYRAVPAAPSLIRSDSQSEAVLGAWRAAWGVYFATALRQRLGFGDVSWFMDPSGAFRDHSPFAFSLASPGTRDGPEDTLSVAYILWNMTHDRRGQPVSQDGLALPVPESELWQVVFSYVTRPDLPGEPQGGSLEKLWDGWLSQARGHRPELQALFASAGVWYSQDAFEDDDSPATARTLAVGDPPARHSLYPAGDRDWVRFEAVADRTYSIETFDLGGGADTRLKVFAPDGTTPLAENDDEGPGDPASRVLFSPESSATYYVRCESAGGNSHYGWYSLGISTITGQAPRMEAVHSFGHEDDRVGCPLVGDAELGIFGVRRLRAWQDSFEIFRASDPAGLAPMVALSAEQGEPASILKSTNGDFFFVSVSLASPARRWRLWRTEAGGTPQMLHEFDSGSPEANLVERSPGTVVGLFSDPAGTSSLYQCGRDGQFMALHTFGGRDGSPIQLLVPRPGGPVYVLTEYPTHLFRIDADTALTTFLSTGYRIYRLSPGPGGSFYGIGYGSSRQTDSLLRIDSSAILSTVAPVPAALGYRIQALMAGSNGSYFGAMEYGGAGGGGSLFSFDASGSFNLLQAFGSGRELHGAYPGSLIQGPGGFLYGTLQYGGRYGIGILFRLAPPPPGGSAVLAGPRVLPKPGYVDLRWSGLVALTMQFSVSRADSREGPFGTLAAFAGAGGQQQVYRDSTGLPGHAYFYRIGIRDNANQPWRFSEPLQAVPPELRLSLALPVPNPMRGLVRLEFEIAHAGPARLDVYNVLGQRVRTLLNGPVAAGRTSLRWDGRDSGGRFLGSGMYFVRLLSGGESAVRKILLME